MLRIATEGVFGADDDAPIEWLPAEGYLRTLYSPVVLRPRREFALPAEASAFALSASAPVFTLPARRAIEVRG